MHTFLDVSPEPRIEGARVLTPLFRIYKYSYLIIERARWFSGNG